MPEKTPWTPETAHMSGRYPSDDAGAFHKVFLAAADFQRYKEAHGAMWKALAKSLDALEEVLEDTDGPDGERVPNPLLVEARAALALATEVRA